MMKGFSSFFVPAIAVVMTVVMFNVFLNWTTGDLPLKIQMAFDRAYVTVVHAPGVQARIATNEAFLKVVRDADKAAELLDITILERAIALETIKGNDYTVVPLRLEYGEDMFKMFQAAYVEAVTERLGRGFYVSQWSYSDHGYNTTLYIHW